MVEMLGVEQHVHVEVEATRSPAYPAGVPGEGRVRTTLTASRATSHLFDHESGEALRAPAHPAAAAMS